jgi:hypothetical protein
MQTLTLSPVLGQIAIVSLIFMGWGELQRMIRVWYSDVGVA